MKDELDIPDFLDLRIPENLERWKQARKDWRPSGRAAREAAPKVERDFEGNALPRNMDDSTRAFLASIEKAQRDKAKEADAKKDERFRVLAVQRAEKAAIKKAAKEASKASRAAFTKG
jgi:hypothetical protein